MSFSAIQGRNKFFLAPLVMLVVVLCLCISSCSTKKNTFINRNFHNLTAHYNVYWNGNDALEEGYKEFQKTIKDNYTGILPVYNTGNIQEAGQMNGPADRALEKGSATIQRHSMFIDKKEHCKWIDDAYLMMGKAYFHKREYNSAKRTFEFVIANFQDPKMVFQARLWLVHTLDKTEKFNISATELELARLMINQKQVSKRQYLSFYNETAANHYILMKEYPSALPFLKNAIQYAQTTKMRRRLQFISGQIYQYLEECQKASEYYALLVKKNTSFEIGFNSRINLAKCYAAGSGDTKTIIAQLQKMLKEKKYQEYRDQIYYALYEIAHKNEDVASEKEYLRQSVATSVQNDYQKSLSALTLAAILFDERDYETSQAYYDTTLQVLPKDYPDYENIKARGAILTDLVTNLIVIREQDSLQRVADMPETERFAFVDKIINEIIAEERRKEEEERRIAELGYRDPRYQESTQNTGSWYFYNPQTVTMGRKDFMRKFGSRKLEDLWIISNKQSFDWGNNEAEEVVLGPDGLPIEDTIKFETDEKKREFYLQNLPLTPELRRASDSMIIIAYFNAGNIYRDRLYEPARAADTYKDLIERYPDTATNKYLLLTYYLIIKCYAEIGDDINRQKYIDMLVSQYPESDVARLILDPDYYKDMEARIKSVQMLYEKTYLAYKGEQHYMVLINADRANEEFSGDVLIPKFDFLKAMSSGSLISRDSTVVQLRRLIVKYPYSDIRPRAEEVYALLTGKKFEFSKEEEALAATAMEEKEISIYPTEQVDGTQLLAVYLPDVYNSNAIRIRIADFNSQNYKVSALSVNNVMFDKEKGMVTVGVFANKEAAMKYYYHIMSDNYVMGIIKTQPGAEVIVISSENYPIFYQDQDISKYKSFFQKNYL